MELEKIKERLDNLLPSGDSRMKLDQVMTIITEMHDGVSHFFFEKKDFSTREAFGTTAACILEQMGGELQSQEDESRNRSSGLVSFFDCTKKEWRCFRPESLISVDYSYND